jgi:hypothetical protein
MKNYSYIKPHWPAPSHVKAYTILRSHGDLSQFSIHRKNECDIEKNRAQLIQELKLPADPIWLEQSHTTIVLPATPENRDKNADASYTDQPNRICVALTADCLPILLCHRAGTQVAAIHAGWRGLGAGIIESTLKGMNINNKDLIVWLGPGISQPNYEVGEEVRELFLSYDKEAKSAFIPSPQGRWLVDLYELARMRLKKQGIIEVYGGEFCTFSDPIRFYSYRRDKAYLGNMATMIWIEGTGQA